MLMAKINHKQRRGLSSVVGAVFMVLVMIGALNVILLAMQQQDKVTQAVVEKSNSSLGKLNEEVKISEVKVTSANRLNMTVTNNGGSTAKLASIYIVNETASPKTQYRFELGSIPVDGRVSIPNIGSDLAFVVKNNMKYSIKIVTTAGNTATTGITPISQVALPMSLFIIPPTVSPGNNVSLLFTVTNNITDSNLAWEVTPWLDVPECNPACTLTLQGDAPAPTMIGKGNTALFKWTYFVETSDEVEHELTFNASLVDAKEGNFVIERGTAKLVDSAQISYQSEIIIANDLIQKPEIFLIIPSPFGESGGTGQQGLWGVVVINPTENNMTVTRVILNVYTSNANANQKMVDSTKCDTGGPSIELTPVSPTTTSEWSCPHDNMLEWRDTTTPEQIDGYSAKTFMVLYEPGTLTAGDESAFMISAGVFTSLGQFTKTGLSSSMSDTVMSIANVYMTDTTNTANAVVKDNMFGHMNGFEQNTEITLNVTLADLDTAAATTVSDGTKLIINVPRGFTNVEIVDSTGFDTGVNEPQIILYGDGTTQIVATVNGAVGDTSKEARILSFNATTPIVEGVKVYIMHIHADGQTSASWSVGPTAQVALQICEDLNDC
jgi:archaellum component FlaF (FlaF/FlaG flagellin family)